MKDASAGKFDAIAFTNRIWKEQLPAKMDSAIELNAFIKAIEANREEAFAKYSNAMAIGNYRYSLIKLNATVTKINENDMELSMQHADSTLKFN